MGFCVQDLALLSSGLKSIGETFIRHIVTCRSVLEDIATIQIVQDYESKSQNLVFVTAKVRLLVPLFSPSPWT